MEKELPEQIKDISKRMRVVYLGQSRHDMDPWEALTGKFTIGKEIDVEKMNKHRQSDTPTLEFEQDL